MIGLEHYLTVAAALFVIGIFGLFLNRKNVIILLMSIELMLLAHPQTVDRAAIPSTQQPRLAFAVAVLAQNIQAAAPFQASDPLAAAIWHALSTPVLPQAATGPEIAQALIQLSNGENGDIYALNQSLRQLRAMGLSDHASRIAAQLTILDAR